MLISLEEIKLHLRMETYPDSEQDPYIENLYFAAVDYAENFLGRELPADSNGLNRGVRAAILLIIADLFENREGQVVGAAFQPNVNVTRLLHFHRIGLGV